MAEFQGISYLQVIHISEPSALGVRSELLIIHLERQRTLFFSAYVIFPLFEDFDRKPGILIRAGKVYIQLFFIRQGRYLLDQ